MERVIKECKENSHLYQSFSNLFSRFSCIEHVNAEQIERISHLSIIKINFIRAIEHRVLMMNLKYNFEHIKCLNIIRGSTKACKSPTVTPTIIEKAPKCQFAI